MPKWLLPALLALAHAPSAVAGATILVSEVTGASPGAATGSIPVKVDSNLLVPLQHVHIHIVFDPTLMLSVDVQGLNGGDCMLDPSGSYIDMNVVALGGIATGVYCTIDVTALAAGIPVLTEVLLTPVAEGPDLTDGGCFDVQGEPVPCALVGGGVLISISDPPIFRTSFE